MNGRASKQKLARRVCHESADQQRRVDWRADGDSDRTKRCVCLLPLAAAQALRRWVAGPATQTLDV